MDRFNCELADQVSRIYRVALRIVGSAEAAQDVAQETCVKALRNASTFNGDSTLSTWIHRITINCAHDHLRKVRRLERGRTEWTDDVIGQDKSLVADPADEVQHTELYRLAQQQVAALPEECRTAFVLTQLDGYSYDDAASIESVPRGTIASRVWRARKILMDQMDQYLDGAKS